MLRKRFSALILALFVVSVNVSGVVYAKSPVYVIAGSDFQALGSDIPAENDAQGAEYMSSILYRMESIGGYTTFNGFLFCGDYSNSMSTEINSAGLAKVEELITEKYPECVNRFYVQGNHDPADTVGLSPSGANDTEDYGVYIIHEDEFPHNVTPAETKSVTEITANKLKAYLKDKIEQNYKKPVFIITHLPLHFNTRTVKKNNALYGNLLYDVIDDAAEYGLNIVYLFGHNHSGAYDYYLGDNAIYLEPGDEIVVAQGSTEDTQVEKLNFIYMNAGYVGYTADKRIGKLTMTVFKIEDDKITTERYSMIGRYNLKNQGINQEMVYGHTKVNDKIYESPRTVSLDKSPAEWGVEWTYGSDSGCYADQNTAKGVARFLFAADASRGRIKESGVVYLKPDGSEITRSQTGTKPVFYSEIVNIPLNSLKKCYAKAYCTVESSIFDDAEQTFWSDTVECDINYSRFVTITK